MALGRLLTVTLNASVDKAYRIDDFTAGGIYRAQQVESLPGGKGLNVASVGRQLGLTVLATGFLAGFNGRFIEAELQKRTIATDFCWLAGESRVCLNITDAKSGRQTEVREPGPAADGAAAAAIEARLGALVRPGDWVCLSGSVPPGTPADIYARLIAAARAGGARVLLDSSGEPLAQGLAARPDVVKPNAQELADLALQWGWVTPAERAALAELDRGSAQSPLPPQVGRLLERLAAQVPIVLCSLGGRGALLATPEERWRLWPPAVTVANTVGCGDALVAGFCAGLLQGRPPLAAAVLGVACGASAATLLGTGQVVVADLDRLQAGVKWRAGWE